jgi:hypothetical protein
MNRGCILTEAISCAAILAACGSSADENPVTRRDGGTSDSAPTNDARRGSPSDASLGSDGPKKCSPFGKPECAPGQTCCLSSLIGTCTDLAACTTTTQFECSQSSTCPAGNLCCATFKTSLDGGPTATTLCRKTCAPPEGAVCHTSVDCSAGRVCTVLPEGLSSPILAAAVESFSVCLPADGGAGP